MRRVVRASLSTAYFRSNHRQTALVMTDKGQLPLGPASPPAGQPSHVNNSSTTNPTTANSGIDWLQRGMPFSRRRTTAASVVGNTSATPMKDDSDDPFALLELLDDRPPATTT